MTISLSRSLVAVLGTALMALSVSAIAAEMNYGNTVPAGAKAGDLRTAPCEVRLEGDDRTYPGDCGTLVVPENRRNPKTRLIALPVTRIRATGAAPLEPLFWFEGGPGGPNVMNYATDGLLLRHDLVRVGYRGAEGQVVLECPELGDATRAVDSGYLSDRAMAGYARAATACARRLQAEGVDLDGYSMNQTIDDMEAARTALGYDRINLLGESYGTRLEIIYEWRYPQSLHRVVMAGVNPPGHFIYYPQVVESQLGQYAALCAKDAYCRQRTPDLLATMRNVSRHMPSRWLGIPIDPDVVKMLSFLGLMESIRVPGDPMFIGGPAIIDMWLDAAEGDASGMALTSLLGSMMLPAVGQRAHLFAMGMSAPDLLGAHRDFRAELMPPGAILGSPLSMFTAGMVQGWPASSDQQAFAEAQDTAVETLLISGSIDFSTPMEGARDKLLPHLRNGHQVVLRDFGHTLTIWNSQPQARARLLNTYFDTGVVDASLYRYQAPKFDVDRSWGGVAKVLLAGTILVLGLLILLIVVVGRKLRRRWAARRAGAA